MPQNPVNYARMHRIETSEAPQNSKWEMNNSTKICIGILFIGFLVLYRRWVIKKKTSRPLIDEPFHF